jgi:beta-glucosidase
MRNAVIIALLVCAASARTLADEPFRNPKLPLDARVNNLVSLLTLDEKIGFLGQNAPAVARLNIKAFTNWTEGLHGIGWARGGNLTATQFPQSVGLGETWDTELLRQVGAVEGYEARVYFQKFDGARRPRHPRPQRGPDA